MPLRDIGRYAVFRPSQSQNAEFPTFVTLPGTVTLVNFLQFSKAP